MNIDSEMLRMAFERDDTYTMDTIAMLDIDNGNIIWFGDGLEDIEELPKYKNNPRYITIPGTDHGEWHDVFLEYLNTIDKSSLYMKSIGGTLKQLSDEERYDWENYKRMHADKKAAEFIKTIERIKDGHHG